MSTVIARRILYVFSTFILIVVFSSGFKERVYYLAGQRDAETAMAKGAVKYNIKSEYEPKQVADMIKEILAGYTRDEVPESA